MENTGTENIERHYENADLIVHWKPGQCTHSQKCWRGLIEVFNPKHKPWVNMEGATSSEIAQQVALCPSGALSVEWKNK